MKHGESEHSEQEHGEPEHSEVDHNDLAHREPQHSESQRNESQHRGITAIRKTSNRSSANWTTANWSTTNRNTANRSTTDCSTTHRYNENQHRSQFAKRNAFPVPGPGRAQNCTTAKTNSPAPKNAFFGRRFWIKKTSPFSATKCLNRYCEGPVLGSENGLIFGDQK